MRLKDDEGKSPRPVPRIHRHVDVTHLSIPGKRVDKRLSRDREVDIVDEKLFERASALLVR